MLGLKCWLFQYMVLRIIDISHKKKLTLPLTLHIIQQFKMNRSPKSKC